MINSNIIKLYSLFLENPVITTDSRNIPKNCLFFALKGENFNGNVFAEEALRKGAKYAVIDDKSFFKNEQYILVDDALNTLQQLSLRHRQSLNLPIIGITGSNGKTTTKELIHAVLDSECKCVATKGNLNNHIGVPLTLLTIESTTEIAVVEMGANHIGEIKELCDFALPTHGIITNIGKAHIGGFLSLDNIIKTKTALYESIRKSGQVVFVNADDPLLMNHAKGLNKVTYSTEGDGDINIKFVATEPYLSVLWEGNEIHTNLVGVYNINNIAAAICIGNHFGVKDRNIVKALESYVPKNNRSQLIQTEKNIVIMDAYNANPTSMEAALKSFVLHKGSNKTLVLGDMLELGKDKESEHSKIIKLTHNLGFDDVYFVGSIFFSEKTGKARYFETSEDLKLFFTKHPLENRQILIKGSRGIKLEIVLETF